MWLWLALAVPIGLTIGNPVISNDLLTFEASLSGATSNYYLQGLLRSASSSKYFGETLGSQGSYLDYIGSPEKELITSSFFVTSVFEASWSGKLAMRYKVDDPLYTGPGSYELKLRRFTGGSNTAAGESNTLMVNLSLPLPTPTPTITPTSTPTPSPSPTPPSTPMPSPSPATSAQPLVVPTPSLAASPREATVAGVATSLPEPSPSPSLSPATSVQPLVVPPTRLKVVLGIGAGLLSLTTAIYFGVRKFQDSHV